MSNYEFESCKAKYYAANQKMREDHAEMKSWEDWLESRNNQLNELKSNKYELEGDLKYIGRSSGTSGFEYRTKKAELDLVLVKIEECESGIESSERILEDKKRIFGETNIFFQKCERSFNYQKDIKESQEEIYKADKLQRKAEEMRRAAESKASSARYAEEARQAEISRLEEKERRKEYERNKEKRERQQKLKDLKDKADRARKEADECSIM